jgi:hypothetical protein
VLRPPLGKNGEDGLIDRAWILKGHKERHGVRNESSCIFNGILR